MLHTLNRWQHTLFSACFHLPKDMQPLKNRPLPAAHAKEHQPRVLKAWQENIGNFVERHTAQK